MSFEIRRDCMPTQIGISHKDHGLLIMIICVMFLLTPGDAVASDPVDNNQKCQEVAYINFLDANGSPPVDYVMSKFQHYQVVSLGELHEIEDNLRFLRAILQDERFLKDVGILVWEFGNSNYQHLEDEVLQASTYDETRLVEAYRNHTHPWGWLLKGICMFIRQPG